MNISTFNFFTNYKTLKVSQDTEALTLEYTTKDKSKQKETIIHKKLGICPLCGSSVTRLEPCNVYTLPGIIAKCKVCGIKLSRTAGYTLTPEGQEREKTLQECADEVTILWNSRKILQSNRRRERYNHESICG